MALSLQYPLLSSFTNIYVCTETLQWQLSQQGGSKTDSSDAIPAHTMSEWDPNGGQAPREIEIESGDLDFSGLEEADLSNICFPSAAVGIKPAAPVDIGRPYWSAGLQAHHPGRQQGHGHDRPHAGRLGPSIF